MRAMRFFIVKSRTADVSSDDQAVYSNLDHSLVGGFILGTGPPAAACPDTTLVSNFWGLRRYQGHLGKPDPLLGLLCNFRYLQVLMDPKAACFRIWNQRAGTANKLLNLQGCDEF